MADPSFSVPPRSEDNETFRLLYVGALEPHKGVGYLIKAMRRLPTDVRLCIVGGGRQQANLEQLASDEEVDERIEFTGHLPYEEIPARYAAADAFVHPGVWPEPFGRTILEALEAGIPVVCTDIGGPPEVVPDKDLLCPPADPDGLAAAVRRTIEKEETVSDLGVQERRAHVRKHYHPSAVVSQIVDLYTDLRRDHVA
jgi:glycosyltransferase involved in cell wall biosynthesis